MDPRHKAGGDEMRKRRTVSCPDDSFGNDGFARVSGQFDLISKVSRDAGCSLMVNRMASWMRTNAHTPMALAHKMNFYTGF